MSFLENKQTAREVAENKINSIMNAINKWTSFYRANPQRFAADYLNLHLNRDQQINLNMMFHTAHSCYIASRGGGKSFLSSVFCVSYCILYPGTTVCIASKTRTQSTEIIDKVKDILMPMSANLRMEIEYIQINQSKSEVRFKNGSIMRIVTANDSARHNRATILLVDEFRLLDKEFIDTVLRKFLTSQRHPGFLDKPEYKNYPKEKNKEVYASSAWLENHWSYEHLRTYFVNMIRGRSYYMCALPYQLAICEGRLDREQIEDEMSESTFSSMNFRMEMEALFVGENSGGLYKLEEIERNRKLNYPWYPHSTNAKLLGKNGQIPDKVPGEIRILSADLALMSSNKNKNDATSIFINQMMPTANGKYKYNIVYATNDEGLRTDVQALRIRKLFDEYACDYLVIDSRGLGLGVLDLIMNDMYDASDGTTYEALSCCNNDEIASRCTNPKARKAIWAILGSAELNSNCALGLREAFKQGQIRLLISEFVAEPFLNEIKGYHKLTPMEQIDLKLPYIHTSLAINELINLEYENRNGVIKVKEKAGMRKDRYSSLSYNIYVAKAIEKEQASANSKRSMEEIVWGFRPPKTKKGIAQYTKNNDRGGRRHHGIF